jgi:hypothetical protein
MKYYYCRYDNSKTKPKNVTICGSIEIKDDNLIIRGELIDACERIFSGNTWDLYTIPTDPLQTINLITYELTNIGRTIFKQNEIPHENEKKLGKDYDVFNVKLLLYIERKRF